MYLPPTDPTTLSPIDMWSSPVRVAEFLSSHPNFTSIPLCDAHPQNLRHKPPPPPRIELNLPQYSQHNNNHLLINIRVKVLLYSLLTNPLLVTTPPLLPL